jgi:hypothetical protein
LKLDSPLRWFCNDLKIKFLIKLPRFTAFEAIDSENICGDSAICQYIKHELSVVDSNVIKNVFWDFLKCIARFNNWISFNSSTIPLIKKWKENVDESLRRNSCWKFKILLKTIEHEGQSLTVKDSQFSRSVSFRNWKFVSTFLYWFCSCTDLTLVNWGPSLASIKMLPYDCTPWLTPVEKI